MIGGVEWSNVHLAGAFLLGAMFSAVVVLRLVRVLARYLGDIRKENRNDDEPDR